MAPSVGETVLHDVANDGEPVRGDVQVEEDPQAAPAEGIPKEGGDIRTDAGDDAGVPNFGNPLPVLGIGWDSSETAHAYDMLRRLTSKQVGGEKLDRWGEQAFALLTRTVSSKSEEVRNSREAQEAIESEIAKVIRYDTFKLNEAKEWNEVRRNNPKMKDLIHSPTLLELNILKNLLGIENGRRVL